MTIAGVAQNDSTSGSGGFGAQTIGKDSYEQGLIGKINNLQQRLQKLNEDKNLSVEEKQEKRKELMQNIADLNAQLRQYRFDKQHEKKEKVNQGYAEQNKKKEEKQKQGMSAANMESIVAGDMAMKQSAVSSQVSRSLSGKASVLEGEIRMDQDSGNPQRTAWKEESLKNVEAQAEQAMQTSFEKMGEALKKAHSSTDTAEKQQKTEEPDKAEEHGMLEEPVMTEEPEKMQAQVQKSIDVRV